MKWGLWVVDVQEKLFPKIDRSHEILDPICFILEAASSLQLPILVTEQYPKGLGPTIGPIVERLSDEVTIWEKTLFSGYADPDIRTAANEMADAWILVGIEAHICIFQTARDLKAAGRDVIVCNDAISSRSLFDFSTAVGQMRDLGVQVSSTEAVIYDLVKDAASPEFKRLLPLIKQYA